MDSPFANPSPSPSDIPLVSVAIITYNHRQFISQALDSVLSQYHNFLIEIVISDDCSQDGTGLVIDEFQALYPDIIRRVDPPHNVGMHANLDRVWRSCRGKYIAMLEGDDWWHSPNKLLTQVVFMEGNPHLAASGHIIQKAKLIDGRIVIGHTTPARPQQVGIKDLIRGNYIVTCSAMYRRGIIDNIPIWIRSLAMADWPLSLLHALHGQIGYINETLATYRVHGGGVWSSICNLKQEQHERDSLLLMQQYFPEKYQRDFDLSIADRCYSISYMLRQMRKYKEARRYLLDYLRIKRSTGELRLLILCKCVILLICPQLTVKRYLFHNY